MKVEYKRTAKCSYMIVQEADYEFEPYELQMVLYNRIPGLLELQVIVADGQVEYWYDVTGVQSLSQIFSVEQIDYIKLQMLLQGICKLKRHLDAYMISDASVDFSPEMIYLDRSGQQVHFCYIPGYEQTDDSCIRGFIEELLQHLNHTDPRAVKLGYRIYEQCSQSGFTIEDCERCIREAEDELLISPELEYAKKCEPENEPGMTAEETVKEPPRQKKRFSFGNMRAMPHAGSGRRKKAVDYAEAFEQEKRLDYVAEKAADWKPTVYFSEEEQQRTWILAYRGDGLEQDLILDSFPFLIGKDPKRADGILQADTVSRIHARILEREGELLVEDYNSTNGTYLNGKLLSMNTPAKLKEGDRLVFATEEYILVDRKTAKC